jgi:hypothetical protein
MTKPNKKAYELKRRWSNLLNDRAGWEKGWRDLGKYLIPHRSNVNLTVTNGQNQTAELYDGVGVHANELLASSMAGSLTSPATRWFSLRMRNPLLARKKKVREWLEDAANVVYHELRQSNFHSEAHEGYKDISGLGTMAIFVDAKDKKHNEFQGLKFQALSIGEYAIAEDAEGKVNVLFRLFKLTRAAVVEKFGLENCSEKTKKLHNVKPDEQVEILHAVYPREGGKENAKKATLKMFASVYMELAETHIVRESGYDEFPYMVARWDKTSGEQYGRGPGHTALPNIKTLNKIQELFLKALAKVISPPMKQRHNGVIGKVRLTPDSLNTVLEMDDLQPIEFGSNFSVTYQEKADLRQEIRHIFFWDQLQLQQGTQMTATEVERRWELMQRLLGPTLGRIENEFLNPLIFRVMQELNRNKRLPVMPDELLMAAQNGTGDDIDVVYEGPLARAQRSSEMAALEKTMAIVQALKETFPEIADNFNADAIAEFVADVNGLSPKLMNDPKMRDNVRQIRQKSAAKAQDTEIENVASGTAKNMADAVSTMSAPEVQEAAGGMMGQPQGVAA